MAKHITIYTDGACSGNPGPGGWGAILLYKETTKEIYGGELNTTNNRMELLAVIKSLQTLKESCIIDLYTDSQYVQLGMSKWLEGWKSKKKLDPTSKKPVKNIDLWCELDQESQKHQITWHWVRGHDGNYYNEIADQLARNGLEEIKNV